MNATDVLQRCRAAGVQLVAREGAILAAPPIPDDIRALVVAHKAELLPLLANPAIEYAATVQEAHAQRAAWRGACFELAEALGFPRLPFRQGLAIGPGDAPWRLFLSSSSADMATLRNDVLPALKARLAAVPAPEPKQ